MRDDPASRTPQPRRQSRPPTGGSQFDAEDAPRLVLGYLAGDPDRLTGELSVLLQDANLRRALRMASPAAAERISVELDAVASELAEAKGREESFDREYRPYRITSKLIQELIDQMTGLLDTRPSRRASPGSGTSSSGSTSTASSSALYRGGRRQPIGKLTGLNQ